jgi:hypothetical protein
MELAFGNCKHPPYVDRLIPDSETNAWNDLGQRVPKGCCHHSMVGSLAGTDRWFRRSTRGSEPDGLTDYGIGGDTDGPDLDGVIWRWNDPRGRRAGWASGGSDGLEGDGPMFVRTLGVNAINRDLVSIELSDGGNIHHPVSDKQFESCAQLTAYWFDQAHVPYDAFPVNPNAGCVTDMEHFEFALKACPFDRFRPRINEFQDRVRMILRTAQVVTIPAPPPTPVPPETEWPHGWTTEELAEQFGKVRQILIDKKNVVTGTRLLGFDPKGVLSNMWIHRALDEGITDVTRIPKPSHFTVTRAKDDTGCSVFIVPRSGYKDWIGFRGDGNASWIWIQ